MQLCLLSFIPSKLSLKSSQFLISSSHRSSSTRSFAKVVSPKPAMPTMDAIDKLWRVVEPMKRSTTFRASASLPTTRDESPKEWVPPTLLDTGDEI
ncbi:hypothetical protein V6Z11_D10G134000 [Gossypium hirsutum]